MSASNRSEAAPVKTTSSSVLIIPIYTAAIFLSAALLFAVQPMFTKMVLPRFGGSPSVWSVAMVFFQGILLLGYAYADILTRFVRGPLAFLIHLPLMLGGAVWPRAPVPGAPPAFGRIAYWVAPALVASRFKIAATTPLPADVAGAPFSWVAPLSLLPIRLIFGVQPAHICPTSHLDQAPA